MYEKYDDIGALHRHQRRRPPPAPDYLATIHHGIDTDAFAFHDGPDGYLLFFGRIHPDKGTARPSRSPVGPGCRWSSPASSRTRNCFRGAPLNRTSERPASRTQVPVGP